MVGAVAPVVPADAEERQPLEATRRSAPRRRKTLIQSRVAAGALVRSVQSGASTQAFASEASRAAATRYCGRNHSCGSAIAGTRSRPSALTTRPGTQASSTGLSRGEQRRIAAHRHQRTLPDPGRHELRGQEADAHLRQDQCHDRHQAVAVQRTRMETPCSADQASTALVSPDPSVIMMTG